MPKFQLMSPQPLVVGNPETRHVPVRSWGSPGVGSPLGVPGSAPPSQFDRVARQAQSALGGTTSATGQVVTSLSMRILTPAQIDLIYQRCPDVRSSIDGIVRRVATHDWEVCPLIELDDARYDDALAACESIERWLARPTKDGLTWQEVMTMFVTDLLKHDAAAMERVRDRRGRLAEAVPIRGPDVHPIQDAFGRLEKYVQLPYSPSLVDFTATAGSIDLDVDQVLYMSLFPSTNSPEGQPLMEALVNEVITILRTSEYWAHSVDLNEVPPGLLVVVGIAHESADRMKAEYEQKAAADWKMRILTSPKPGDVSAEWIQFRRDPKELQLVELADVIRRTIWRVFGVSPVEQGATEGMPRATAEVQLDVSGSHLIQPILELLQAKVNALLVADLVDPAFADLVEFRWVTHKELTEAERLEQAQTLCSLVDRGILTRDEARETLGYAPFEDELGEVPTVVVGKRVMRLEDALKPPPDPLEVETAKAETAAKGGNAEDAQADASGPGDAPADKGKKKAQKSAEVAHIHRHGARTARSTGSSPPPGWMRAEVTSACTLDLVRLWDEMVGYEIDVDQVWEQARGEVLDAVAAETVMDAQARARVQAVLRREMDRLATEWAVVTAPRYRRVAEQARVRASDWTHYTRGAEVARAEADAYHLMAMGFLSADDGLLADVTRSVMDALVEADGAERARGSIGSALGSVGKAWDRARHRVGNWVGKLVELASKVFAAELLAGNVNAEGEDRAWCEWADVGGPEECATCQDYGSRGWFELASLTIYPGGGGTECRANCRCVLRVVTRKEIEDGTVQLVGAGNTP